jgi:hypothetical protein
MIFILRVKFEYMPNGISWVQKYRSRLVTGVAFKPESNSLYEEGMEWHCTHCQPVLLCWNITSNHLYHGTSIHYSFSVFTADRYWITKDCLCRSEMGKLWPLKKYLIACICSECYVFKCLHVLLMINFNSTYDIMSNPSVACLLES